MAYRLASSRSHNRAASKKFLQIRRAWQSAVSGHLTSLSRCRCRPRSRKRQLISTVRKSIPGQQTFQGAGLQCTRVISKEEDKENKSPKRAGWLGGVSLVMFFTETIGNNRHPFSVVAYRNTSHSSIKALRTNAM
jgi:hypothetical protein